MKNIFALRTISAKKTQQIASVSCDIGVYIHQEDVVNLLREFGSTEETDVRNRLEQLACSIAKLK